jgi:hypothetical protein
MFTLIEGEIEFTFRGKKSTVRAGSTVNIAANAPHSFLNNTLDWPLPAPGDEVNQMIRRLRRDPVRKLPSRAQ